MKKLLIISTVFLSSCTPLFYNEEEIKKELNIIVEKAYFEGQKDALEKDIRIKLNRDSVYIWTKSPWDDGTLPIYYPNYLETKRK